MTGSAIPAPSSCEDLLREMVACDTVNPRLGGPPDGQDRLADRIEAWARTWQLATRRFPLGGDQSNLLVCCEATTGPGAPWLLFDSHLDTVATVGMTVPPFELMAAGGRLHGRGACDTKGSGAAMLWALREYARAGDRPNAIGVLFTADEEMGMTGARALAAGPLAEFLPRLRGMVVGEPTGLCPVVATNGVVRWRTVTRGVAAHSSDPARGRSAISAMVRVIDALESRYVPGVTASHPLTGRAAASVNVIRGGTQVNIIPDFCAIECDRRLAPGETAAQALTDRDRALADCPGVEHDSVYSVPPLHEAMGRRFFEWAQSPLLVAGCAAQPAGAAYVTNGSIYAEAGAPVLVLGPGHAAQAHTCDEWVARDELARAVVIYRALMGAA